MWGWLVLRGWVVSEANKWEDYSNCFGEVVGISRNWVTAQFWPLRLSLGTIIVPVHVSFRC